MNRTHFFPRHVEYLFSVDLELAKGRRASVLPMRCAITSCAAKYEVHRESDPLTVYHALRESHVLGEPAIQGWVELAQERIEFAPGDDFGDISGRLVLRTKDGAVIEASYRGVVRAGSRWALLSRDGATPADKDAVTLDARAHITTHFETGSTKYSWLVQHQCVGYGKLKLRGGEPLSATFDIYALSAGKVKEQHAARASA